MSISKLIKQKALTVGDISLVIQLAWEDRTSFETIQERVGLSEAQVINLMRAELKVTPQQTTHTQLTRVSYRLHAGGFIS
jgi:uncharacterized protein (TIGR03643 family)